MLSTLQALQAGTAGKSSRASAFEPRVKLRFRGGEHSEKRSPQVVVEEAPSQHKLHSNDFVQGMEHEDSTLRNGSEDLQPRQAAAPLQDDPAKTSALPPSAQPAAVCLETCASERSKAKSKKRSSSSSTAVSNLKETPFRDFIAFTEAQDRKRMKEKEKEKVEEVKQIPVTSSQKEVMLAPQVKIINGRIAIDPESLSINANALNTNEASSYRRIDETHRKLNYRTTNITYKRWNPEETRLFYKAVQQFGTDFALIERMFPNKTRRQVKNKYNREARENPKFLPLVHLQQSRDMKEYEDLLKLVSESFATVENDDEFAFTWDVNKGGEVLADPTDPTLEQGEDGELEEHFKDTELG